MGVEYIDTNRKHSEITGEKFGMLTASKFLGRKNNKDRIYWLFTCDCGSQVSRTVGSIRRNKYNCCDSCFTNTNSHAWKGHGEFPKDVYNTIYHGAKARNIDFNVSIEELWQLYLNQNRTCVLTGWPIAFNSSYNAKTSKTASLDRIDSSKGYVIENLQWVHKLVNKLKKNIDDKLFIELCVAVANNQKEIN